MTISDEQLSAFLDAELPEAEMEWVRQQLVDDENLANRLAELAMVDDQVARHYAQIDERPLPVAITRLLATEPNQASNNIIPFPLWKRVQRGLQQHAAIAACTLLVIGFGMVQLLPGTNNNKNNWSAVAQVLEKNASGDEQHLDDGSRVKPRLTFINNNGNYCRQFQLIERDKSSENIACRNNNYWELVISEQQETLADGDYQTASGGSLLDNALDEMMSRDAFDAAAEQQAINSRWSH
ncbi:MAG: hypothetical protein B0W54_16035 [Cellvibrio sp. 79]|nr:MAG: hypothetical protein B0W54_16035 [Cellvibrio sp. 79]